MDLNLLEVFVLVAETGSFTTAAKRKGVQRSSVSRAVAALEAELDVQLFARSTRHVALTSAGATLFAKVRPQLAALHESVGALPEREEAPSGLLRVTAPTDLGTTILPDVVASFLARYPGVSVALQLGNAPLDLVAEGVDVAIRAGTQHRKDSSLVSRKIADADLQLCASPTYLAAHGTPRRIEDGVEHDWISFRGRPLPPPLRRPKRAPRIIADDMLFVRRAAIAGLGIGMLPSFLIRDDLVTGRLVRVLPKMMLRVPGGLYFMHPPSQHIPRKVTAFRDHLLEILAAHPLSARADGRAVG